MSSPTEFAIEARGLTKHYGSQAVVDALDLRVPRGCVYGFLGRNGAGKSTMIKMLTGMVHADRGEAFLLGENVRHLAPATRARIAYLAEGHPLYNGMTIGQAVDFTRPFYPSWNQHLIDQVLDHFELGRSARLGKLSNGQRAQVSLALAIAPEPELMILDDPTLGLDTVVRRDFLESMIQIIQRKGRTILFSSHILGDVERVADRIGVMVNGRLRADCPTDVFKDSIRRVVLEFDRDPPEFPPVAGIVSSRAVGRRRELVVVGFNETHRRLAESLVPQPLSFEVMEMNLEDAFVEYTRGRQRSLPMFEGAANA